MNPLLLHPIEEAARSCGIPKEVMLQFISYAWIVPANREQGFLDDEDLARTRFILELKTRLGVNDEGVGIILHLLDQLYALHFNEFR